MLSSELCTFLKRILLITGPTVITIRIGTVESPGEGLRERREERVGGRLAKRNAGRMEMEGHDRNGKKNKGMGKEGDRRTNLQFTLSNLRI